MCADAWRTHKAVACWLLAGPARAAGGVAHVLLCAQPHRAPGAPQAGPCSAPAQPERGQPQWAEQVQQ